MLSTILQTTTSSPAPTLGGWFHDLSPFLFRFTPTFGVRYYGLSYALGFVCAYLLLRFLSNRNATLVPKDRIGDAMMYLILGTLIGGRLFYVIGYEPALLTKFMSSAPWWGVLAINNGGMASHGGILGCMLACWRISRGFKDQSGKVEGRCSVLHVFDTAVLLAPLGLFFGRVANFINGELLGAIVAKPGENAPWWAVRYPQEITAGLEPHQLAQTPEQFDQIVQLSMNQLLPSEEYWEQGYARMLDKIQRGNVGFKAQLEPLLSARYPTQLMQAGLDGLLVLVVVWIVAMKPRKPGLVAGVFAMVYALGRIPMDIVRLPDAGVTQFGPLTRGQTYSAITFIVGVLLVVHALRSSAPKLGGWLKHTD